MKTPKLDILANELSLNEIKDLLRRKERETVRLEKLQVKRKTLLTQIQDIEVEMRKLEGEVKLGKSKAVKKSPGKGKRSRKPVKGGKTVRELTVEYLRSAEDKARLVDIIAYVVKKRKGETKPTATDRTAVSVVLRKEKSVKRVGKGLYRLVGEKKEQE